LSKGRGRSKRGERRRATPTQLVVDASVVLKGYLPEEGSLQAQALFRDRALGYVELHAPSLIVYEISNALLVAARRDRIDLPDAEEILREFSRLRLALHEPHGFEERIWTLAQTFGRTSYDAAYLALGESLNAFLVTGDRRLYNAVRPKLDWVTCIEDYQPKSPPEPAS